MLADKFWLNPDSKMIWVSDTHMKTVIDNPETFEFKNEQQLKKIIENVIWCEYDDKNKILSLRSSSKKFLREGVDDLKEHIDQFYEIHLVLVLDNGAVIKYRLVGKDEIKLFLDEMIIGRKASYIDSQSTKLKTFTKSTKKKNIKKPNFIQKIKKFINKLYA